MATRAEWKKRVERWNKSGKTAEEFAAEEGIRAKQLAWWRWKLRVEPAALKAAGAPSFLPVRVVEPPAPTFLCSALMDIVLPNGRIVRVAPGFNLAALAHVLRIAEQEHEHEQGPART
jgi:transposase